MLGGNSAKVDFRKIMMRRLTITGSTLRPRPVAFKGAIAKSLREKIWPLIERGKIKPEIFKTFPLEQAAEAHRLMESSQHIGKIVLTTG
jgi:NADPH2:quinone reductase